LLTSQIPIHILTLLYTSSPVFQAQSVQLSAIQTSDAPFYIAFALQGRIIERRTFNEKSPKEAVIQTAWYVPVHGNNGNNGNIPQRTRHVKVSMFPRLALLPQMGTYPGRCSMKEENLNAKDWKKLDVQMH